MYSTGISREASLIDLAVKHDIFAKSGSWYSYQNEKIGQGKEQVRQYLLEHADVALRVENLIRDLNGLPQAEESAKISTREVKPVERESLSSGKSSKPVSFSSEEIAIGE